MTQMQKGESYLGQVKWTLNIQKIALSDHFEYRVNMIFEPHEDGAEHSMKNLWFRTYLELIKWLETF